MRGTLVFANFGCGDIRFPLHVYGLGLRASGSGSTASGGGTDPELSLGALRWNPKPETPKP